MKKISLSFYLFVLISSLYAEGSKQFLLTPTDSIYASQLNIYSTSSGTGSIMNCPEFKRIYIHITDPATEKIDIGFKNTTANRYFRIFRPNGTLLVPGTALPTAGSVAGRIPFALQNIQGPSNTVATGGYVPLVYTPDMAGDYWIEFNRDNNFTSQVLATYSFSLWDISVVKTTTSPYTPINGRVFCKYWNLFSGNTDPMRAITYAYTSDSIIHRINFNGMAGANFTLSMNSFGVTNSGAVVNNRKSIFGDASALDTVGEYKLFFNLPDTSYFELTRTPLDLEFAQPTLTGCNTPTQNISQCIRIICTKPGVVDLLINLNGIAGYQAGTADVLIPYNVIAGLNCIPWNGMNGLGQYVAAGTSISLTATIQIGLTHIPLYDVEENPNGFIVQCILPTTIANTPNLFYDDTNLGAGSNFIGCPSPCHTWSNAIGNNNTLNTWFFGTYVSKTTTVVGPSYSPQFSTTQTNPSCQQNLTNGTITYTNISPYTFQANDSLGIYQPPLTSPSSYTLVTLPHTFTGVAAGTYVLVIKNGQGCSFTQTVTLTAIGLPTTAVAGPNQTLCLPSNSVTMAANTPLTGTGAWAQISGPLGAVITNTASPTTSVTGLLPGNYVFQWAITSGICPPSTSNVNITVYATPVTPTVTSNAPVCQGASINLFAQGTSGSTYSWTGPNGFVSSSQNPTLTNATTLMAGTYTVTAQVGNCTVMQNTTTIVVNTLPPTPTATSNAPLCAGNTINLSSNSTGVNYNWIGPNAFSSSSQNPSIANANTSMSGTYSLTVTNTTTGCTSLVNTTQVLVNITPATPTITSNSPLCVGASLTLNANSTTNSTYSWSGPNGFLSSTQNNSLTNITASQAGTYSVIATLGNCPSLTGTFTILVNQLPPTPTATSNSPICAGASINLNTSTQTGFNYVWTGPNGFNSAMQNPTLNNATSAMAGTYSLTVTNQSTGCTSIAGTTLVVINLLPPTPQATSNTPICTGNTINLSTSTTGTLNYTWNGPNSFNSIIQNPSIVNATSAMAGTYSLTVTNTATGCTSSIATTIVVINQTPITPTVSSNSAICTGQTLSLQSGSTTGSSYSWTGPNAFTSTQQNPSLVNTTTAQSGTYTVTATLVGCSSQQSLISVIINPLPPTPIATSNSPLCEGNTINFNTTTIGVNYVWLGPNSFSSTSQNPSLINATTAMSGTYSLTITNIATGCTSLIGTTQVVVNTTPTTPTITSNAPICVGASLSLNANSTANTAYNWIGPNGFTSVTQNNNLTNVTLNQAGTYTVIATLGNCPSALSTFTVAINPLPPTPGAINNTPICIGSPINLSTTATGVNYNWIGPNSFSNSTQNPTIGTSALVNAGTYSLTVTNTITGCTSLVGTTLVVINPLPATPVALSNSALCAGDTLLLSTAPLSNTNYSWSGPLGFTSSTQNPVILNSTIPMSGTYSVTITNTTTGCTSNSGIVNVIVNVIPTILSVGNTSPICENASVSFSVTPVLGANYHWNGPNAYNSNIQNPTINNINLNNAGVYTVYATLGSCSSATFSTTVNVNALPATPIATSNSTICIGNSLNLSTGNLNGFTYQWNGPNAFISSLQNPTISNAQLANAGTYSLTVTEINTGCSSIVGTTLAVINSLPTISISSNSPVCEGASINLTSNSSTNVIYNWSGPNSFTSNIQNPNIANATLAMSGTYSATVLDNITGCTSLLSTTNVIVNQTPTTPNATSNSAICAGQALNLQANSSVGASYTWIGPNAFNSNIQNPIINNATIIQAGTYTVGAFIGNCFSPVATVTVTINALPSTIIITSNAPLCVGDTLSLSSTLVNGVTYSWSGPNGFASNIQNPSISNTSLAMSGIYSLSITNTVTGCNSIPASSNILINTLPATPTISTNSPVCYGDSLLLVSNTVGNYSYSWVGPNGYSSTFSNNLILNFGDNNVGDYTLFITNNNTSCKSATAITTVLLDCPDIEDLLIPNVFTPNGDNTNELFTIETKQLKSIEGEIYDRWGIKMYAWDSLKEAWNGKTKNGSDAPEGTYYYIINATTFKGKKLTTKGSLMLLR